jgi:hypothetical protein
VNQRDERTMKLTKAVPAKRAAVRRRRVEERLAGGVRRGWPRK